MNRPLFFLITFIFSIINLSSNSVKIYKPKEVKLATKFLLIFEIDDYKEEKITISTENLKNSDFELLGLKQKNNKLELELIPFNIGVSTFPQLTINLIDTNRQINTYPIPIEIKPLFNIKETDQLRDISKIFDFLTWLKILIFLLLLLLAYLIYKKLKRKNIETSTQKVIDTRTPYQRAIDKIEETINSGIVEENVKKYYTRLSDIFRKYIEEEFNINALEMTTNDIIKNIKNFAKIEMVIKTRDFLDACDLVKFAKYIPEKSNIENDTKILREILDLYNNFSLDKKRKEEEEKLREDLKTK